MLKNKLILIFFLLLITSNSFSILLQQTTRANQFLIEDRLKKINFVQSYIENYILSKGYFPNNKYVDLNLTSYTHAILPTAIGDKRKIPIEFARDNEYVVYKALFYNKHDDINLSNLIRHSRFLTQNAIVNDDFSIKIPLSYKSNKLLDSIFNLTSDTSIPSYKRAKINSIGNTNCSAIDTTNKNRTVYIINGSENYSLRYCNNYHINENIHTNMKYDYLPLRVYEYTNDIANKLFSTIGQEIYNEKNASHVELYIFNGNTHIRVEK